MANFNQNPSGQANVSLNLPSLAFVASGTGIWNQPNYVWGGGSTVTLTLTGSIPQFTVLARALGSATTVSSSAASGLFTPNEQSAAKRLGAWPSP
jgi:hypothetical protein